MYQDLDYQITDVIQLNRAKSVFNRAEKKKPNTCEGVRPFPTSKRISIKWWSNIDDLFDDKSISPEVWFPEVHNLELKGLYQPVGKTDRFKYLKSDTRQKWQIWRARQKYKAKIRNFDGYTREKEYI